MNRQIREERRQSELAELVYRQRTLRNEVLRKLVIDEGRMDILFHEILGYWWSDFHKEIMAFQYQRKKSMTLAPRDSGKSTVLNYCKIIFTILRNPNIRIALVSNTQTQAKAFLKEIKNHLEGNEKLIEIFGPQKGSKWAEDEIIVKGRTAKHKDSTVTCIGVGSALIGKHFDMIVMDDAVTEESSRTELQRERQRTWYYQSLYPTLENSPDSEVHVIGTRYHYLDLYGHFMGDTENEGAGEFKDDYLRVKALQEDEEGNLISFLPRKFTVEQLLEKKRNMGTIIFNAQMQNDTQAMKGVIVKDEYFRYYNEWPQNVREYIGVDLAISQKDTGNKFALISIGVDEKKNVYIKPNYVQRKALTPSTQRNLIYNRWNDERPYCVAIESNAYQESVAIDLKLRDGEMNIKKVYTDIDKKSKGWKLSALFEAGRVFVPVDDTEFKEHMLLFTGEDKGEDDLFDAFYNAVASALWIRKKKPRKEPGVLG